MRSKSGATTRRNLLMAVFVLSVLAALWSTFLNPNKEQISLADFIGLIPTIISLLGLGSEDKKRKSKSAKLPKGAKTPSSSSNLIPSFDSGLYGGLIGGVVTGLILVLAYSTAASAGRLAEILIYSSLAGTVFGALSQLIILWFRSLVKEKHRPGLLFNERGVHNSLR